MTIVEAIGAANNGRIIVSNVGNRYTPEMLSPIWCGMFYASFRSCGMTKSELDGVWEAVD
jgi:hypothetical protein